MIFLVRFNAADSFLLVDCADSHITSHHISNHSSPKFVSISCVYRLPKFTSGQVWSLRMTHSEPMRFTNDHPNQHFLLHPNKSLLITSHDVPFCFLGRGQMIYWNARRVVNPENDRRIKMTQLIVERRDISSEQNKLLIAKSKADRADEVNGDLESWKVIWFFFGFSSWSKQSLN